MESYLAGIRKDRFGNAAVSGLPAEILLAISVVVLSVQVYGILRCTFPAISGHVLH